MTSPAWPWQDYCRGRDGLIHYNTAPHDAWCRAPAQRGVLVGPRFIVTCLVCVADKAHYDRAVPW